MSEAGPHPSDDLRRFVASLDPDPYWAWHDGTEYDLDTLRRLSPEEREIAFVRVVETAKLNAAEVAVFEVIGSEAAIEVLQRYAKTGGLAVRLAATRALARLRHEPDAVRDWFVAMFDDPALSYGEFGPLTMRLLDEVRPFDGPELRRAVLDCVRRGREIAPYAASLLLQLIGISNGFAWGTFPYLNKLDSEDEGIRGPALAAFMETLRRNGVAV